MAQILIKCYGTKKIFKSRKEAKKFFTQAMFCSEGNEKLRYINILQDLELGLNFCDDKDGL